MKRGLADVDGEEEKEEEMDSKCNSTDKVDDECTDHEPAPKKPKQHQAPISAPDDVVCAQTQVTECDDLVCLIMSVRGRISHHGTSIRRLSVCFLRSLWTRTARLDSCPW
jgi:hypothetical protein